MAAAAADAGWHLSPRAPRGGDRWGGGLLARFLAGSHRGPNTLHRRLRQRRARRPGWRPGRAGPHCHRRGRHGGVRRTTLRVYERLRRRPGHSGRLLQCHQRRRLDGQHELVERCPHRTVVRRSHRRQRTRSVVAARRQWTERGDPSGAWPPLQPATIVPL